MASEDGEVVTTANCCSLCGKPTDVKLVDALPFVTGMTVLDEGGSVVLDAGPGTVHPTTGITLTYDHKREAMSHWQAPCVLCGYNGPRFYEPTVHPCMAHGSEQGALLAEIARAWNCYVKIEKQRDDLLKERDEARAEVETLRDALERIKDADESVSSAKHMASSAYTAHKLRAKKLGATKASI